MTPPIPDLLVVIVNFRTPDLTIQCLRSLAPEVASLGGPARVRVIVVDNASGDDSVARLTAAIEHEFASWCRLVVSPRNGGFAYGNNRGIEAGGPARHTLLLNSDTIVAPGCLAHCLRVMDEDAGIGAMSCRLLNADGSVQNVCRRFPTPMRLIVSATGLTWKLPRLFAWANTEDPAWDRATTRRDVDWLGGAFLLVRGEVMGALKGLDEGFFFYGEDIEFCHRVWRLGYRCHYDPRVTTTHLGGSSSDPTRMASAARSTHHWRGRYLVLRTCHGVLAAWLVRAVDVLAYSLRALGHRLLRGAASSGYAHHRDVLRVITRRLGRAT